MPEAWVEGAYFVYYEDVDAERVAEAVAAAARELTGEDYSAREFLGGEVVVGRVSVYIDRGDDMVVIRFAADDWKAAEAAYRLAEQVAEKITG